MESRANIRLALLQILPVEAAGRAQLVSRACAAANASKYSQLKLADPDPIFLTKSAYNADKSKDKIDLGIGAYRDNDGKPYVLKVVRKVEKELAANEKLDKEYLGIGGHAGFQESTAKLMFGSDSIALKEKRVATVQGISGTGSLRIGAAFLARFFPDSLVYVSDPTWGNHFSIFKDAGSKTKTYRYWNAKTKSLDFDGFVADLKAAPTKSIILLHACAHNPTGVDPTQDQWKAVAAVMKDRDLLPFFDSAYQGFASGDLERDAWAVRYFVDQGFEMLACQSYAKNFGLYGERIGALNVVSSNAETSKIVYSQLEVIVRPMYSNPPKHGALIVDRVLRDPALFAEWKEELKGMSHRIIAMRKALVTELKALNTPGDWSHITSQIGMFSFTGLSPKQCDNMIKKHHVYLLKSGRISMAGINTKNVKNLAKAIDDSVRNA